MALFSGILRDYIVTTMNTLCKAYILYLISSAVYNVYLHPLSKFPGPRLWAATRFRYILSLWSGGLHNDVQELHRRYGDFVCIAPDELSVAHPDAFHQIYANAPGRPSFPKSKIWHGPTPGMPLSVLTALDPKVHSRIRKAIEPGFTEGALRAQEPIIQKHVGLFIEQLDKLVSEKRSGSGVVVDIVRWFAFTVFDLIGDLGFGEPFDCLKNSEFHPWVSIIFSSLRAATYMSSLKFYPRIDWLLGLAIPKSVLKLQMDHWQLAVDKVNRRLNIEKERPDLISMSTLDDGTEGISVAELQATASVMIVAGSETTVTALSGTVNHLIKNSDKLALLSAEVRAAFQNESDISTFALRDLPYLNAVIQEGLRLCNPSPVGHMRIVPPGGAAVCGQWLPEDTFVSVHNLTLARSPAMFHEPQTYLPERWLAENDPLFSKDIPGAMQPFSVGPRSCIGKSLAWAELRLILARLVWRFGLQRADTEAGRLEWDRQRVFAVVERQPFDVRLKLREGLSALN